MTPIHTAPLPTSTPRPPRSAPPTALSQSLSLQTQTKQSPTGWQAQRHLLCISIGSHAGVVLRFWFPSIFPKLAIGESWGGGCCLPWPLLMDQLVKCWRGLTGFYRWLRAPSPPPPAARPPSLAQETTGRIARWVSGLLCDERKLPLLLLLRLHCSLHQCMNHPSYLHPLIIFPELYHILLNPLKVVMTYDTLYMDWAQPQCSIWKLLDLIQRWLWKTHWQFPRDSISETKCIASGAKSVGTKSVL